MKRLTVKGDKWGSTVEEEFVRTLNQGGLVVHPTETCYGLAVDIFNEDALTKLYRFKQMNQFKPVSIVVSDLEDARHWGEINSRAEELMGRFWPGPYTFIVNRLHTLPPFFNKCIEKVGLRNPAYESLVNIAKKLGHPFTTTSANVSGRSENYAIEDFFTQLKSEDITVEPDLVIDGGFIGVNEPSAVYDCVDEHLIRGDLKI